MKVKVACVLPLRRPTDRENIQKAMEYVDDAVAQDAKIICFPEDFIHSEPNEIPAGDIELYPGVRAFREKARDCGVYIIPGTMAERATSEGFYNTALLIDPKGEVMGKYRKTHLAVGEPRVSGGEEEVLKVFQTEYGKVGIHICYEVCFPEVARITALVGAEMMFWPCGGKYYEIRDSWIQMVRTRAIENLSYVISCSNLFGTEQGIAIITGPEEVLAETDKEGVISATLDIDRIHWLRRTPESYEVPKPFRCVPGTMMHRRPELYKYLSKQA